MAIVILGILELFVAFKHDIFCNFIDLLVVL